MASDIYILLYMFGAGLDQNPMVASPLTYTSAQKKEMAQFAVNYVDALDRDNINTRFEYDTDLSNGWGLDDNPYTNTAAETDRAEVWGCRSAAAFYQRVPSRSKLIRSCRVRRPYDHPATEYDDKVDRFFTLH